MGEHMGLWKQYAAAGAVAASLGLASFAAGTIAQAQATDEAPHPGKLIYDANCAACHNTPEPGSRAAPVAALRKMSAQTLTAALTTGVMKPIGDGLVMYMQMGGNPGDGATLARQTGAAQAAEAFGVDPHKG